MINNILLSLILKNKRKTSKRWKTNSNWIKTMTFIYHRKQLRVEWKWKICAEWKTYYSKIKNWKKQKNCVKRASNMYLTYRNSVHIINLISFYLKLKSTMIIYLICFIICFGKKLLESVLKWCLCLCLSFLLNATNPILCHQRHDEWYGVGLWRQHERIDCSTARQSTPQQLNCTS